MTKKTKITVTVLIVTFLAFSWFIYAQWNNVNAVIHSIFTSQEETKREIEENQNKLAALLEEEKHITIRNLTEEELTALNEGSVTEEEIIESITQKPPKPNEEKPNSSNPNQNPTSTPTPTQKSESEKKIEQLIAKLYVQKSKYLGKLDAIEARVISEYEGNPDNYKDAQSKSNIKQVFLQKHLPTVAAWEKECDATVYGIIEEIREELIKTGKDTSIADAMKKSYREEKKLKKAYFINRYMD